jgi:hypothetical protein
MDEHDHRRFEHHNDDEVRDQCRCGSVAESDSEEVSAMSIQTLKDFQISRKP